MGKMGNEPLGIGVPVLEVPSLRSRRIRMQGCCGTRGLLPPFLCLCFGMHLLSRQ